MKLAPGDANPQRLVVWLAVFVDSHNPGRFKRVVANKFNTMPQRGRQSHPSELISVQTIVQTVVSLVQAELAVAPLEAIASQLVVVVVVVAQFWQPTAASLQRRARLLLAPTGRRVRAAN